MIIHGYCSYICGGVPIVLSIRRRATGRMMSRHAEAGPPPGGPSRLRPFGPASGDVGPDVPHDRVYHLETLAGHGLYRGLVGHAPVAAALVVLPVLAPGDFSHK